MRPQGRQADVPPERPGVAMSIAVQRVMPIAPAWFVGQRLWSRSVTLGSSSCAVGRRAAIVLAERPEASAYTRPPGAATSGAPFGRLAQLVERLPYKQEVTGSSPVPPILPNYLDR